MIAPDGRVVLDIARPGGGLITKTVWLEVDGCTSDRFPWTVVPANMIGAVADRAGLSLVHLSESPVRAHRCQAAADPAGAVRAVEDFERPAATPTAGLTRRGLLRTTWVAAGVATVTTAGAAVPWLRDVAVLGVRSGDGPGGVPINKSARAADVTALATHPSYRLQVVDRGGTVAALTRADLLALPQTTARLPIACVEGWSATGDWTGVVIRDLLDAVGVTGSTALTIVSLQPKGPFRVTDVPTEFVDDPLTLLALKLDAETLSLDHGFPCRIISAARPGVLQTKWVARIEVRS